MAAVGGGCASMIFWFFFFAFLLLQVPDGFRAARGGGVMSPVDDVGVCEGAVAPRGYKCQEFQVETEDGYILSVQRMPEGRAAGGGGRTTNKKKKAPVLLQHGILMDGLTWLLNSPEESLAFVLADAGFDVWIANTRGTRPSRRHRSLDPASKEFWDWSWDELAAYDLPAAVDLVRSHTGQSIHYVGHSLGTLVALASFSEGRLVDKLRSAALLSPVAYLSHMTTPLGVIAAKSILGEVLTWLGLAEFNPKGPIVGDFINSLCHTKGINCFDLMSLVTGTNCCLNSSTVELFLRYEPQPTSTKTLVHLAQVVRNGVLAKYDYGNVFLNLRRYGKLWPTRYDLSSIPRSLPLFLSYGGRDSLSDTGDVARLLDNLRLHDAGQLQVQFVEDYAHADFVIGVSAKKVVYDRVISFFDFH